MRGIRFIGLGSQQSNAWSGVVGVTDASICEDSAVAVQRLRAVGGHGPDRLDTPRGVAPPTYGRCVDRHAAWYPRSGASVRPRPPWDSMAARRGAGMHEAQPGY